jgi:hypothetical protein
MISGGTVTALMFVAASVPQPGREVTHCEVHARSSLLLEWNLARTQAPCEATLKSHGVVVVRVHGGNPAAADYTLSATPVSEPRTTLGAAGQSAAGRTYTAPVTPPAPKFSVGIPTRPTWDIFRQVEQGANAGTARDRNAKKILVITHLERARTILTQASEAGVASGLALQQVCGPHDEKGYVYLLDRNNFWSLAENAAALHATTRRALEAALPPVSETRLGDAKNCVLSLRNSRWGSLLNMGPASVNRAFAESRSLMRDLVASATQVRDTLQGLDFSIFSPAEQRELNSYRETLLDSIREVIATAQRSIDNDFTDETLASVVSALKDAEQWTTLVAHSDSIAEVETNIDGERARSRNVVLQWKPRDGVPNLAPGSRTVLVDRFRGFTVAVTGGAGFAGILSSQVVIQPAFGANGQLIADSMDLVTDRKTVWRPALSTGLAVNWATRAGYSYGLGLELSVITDDKGGATTRIVFPTIHFGRDDIRFFIGNLLGARENFALPDDVNRLRVPRADSVPQGLVVDQQRRWPPDFYIGIVVGQKSLTPGSAK